MNLFPKYSDTELLYAEICNSMTREESLISSTFHAGRGMKEAARESLPYVKSD